MRKLTDAAQVVDIVESHGFKELLDQAGTHAGNTVQHHGFVFVDTVGSMRDGFHWHVHGVFQGALAEFMVGADIDQLAAIFNEFANFIASDI